MLNGLPANYRDHYEMMDDYFDRAVNILAIWDNNPTPNSADKKKYQMAMLYGLDNAQDGDAQQKTRLQNEYNALLSKYHITPSDINTFNINNLNASASDKLPTTGCP